MKKLLVFCGVVTLLLRPVSFAGSETRSLSVPVTSAIAATKGKAYVASLSDDRVFQNKPANLSTPSIDGNVNALSAAQKERMIGRRPSGPGHALGDISLPEGDAVTQHMRALVEEGLRRSGYEVVSSTEHAMPVRVSVDTFWAWTTPGTDALTSEARVVARVTLALPTGMTTIAVSGAGTHHSPSAREGGALEAYPSAFEDFLANFKRELARVETPPAL